MYYTRVFYVTSHIASVKGTGVLFSNYHINGSGNVEAALTLAREPVESIHTRSSVQVNYNTTVAEDLR